MSPAATKVSALTAPTSDSVELVERRHRGLDSEHLERETPVQVARARLALETLHERALHALVDLPVPVHELSPQRHVLESTADRVSGRKIRDWEQSAIRVDIVSHDAPITRISRPACPFTWAKSAARSASL